MTLELNQMPNQAQNLELNLKVNHVHNLMQYLEPKQVANHVHNLMPKNQQRVSVCGQRL